MSASGTGEASTAARSGIARVNPISVTIPSTPDTTAASSMARGTARRASTASSAMSAAASNPTRVKMPISAPPTIPSASGVPGLTVARKARPCPPSGAADPPRTQARNTTTLRTTVPRISANTATLFTCAAHCTRTMLTTYATTSASTAMNSSRRPFSASSPSTLAVSGANPTSAMPGSPTAP